MTSRDIVDRARAAEAAALELGRASDEDRRRAVAAFASALEERRDEVEAANEKDLEAARAAVEAGEMREALVDRLPLQGPKFEATVDAVRAVADLDDPVGRTLRSTRLDDGLELYQVTAPIGVLACAFESRPDAAVQIAALAVRTGNAALLKGGSEAAASNRAVAEAARAALEAEDLPGDAVQNLTERSELQALLDLDDHVDLVVPRGSSELVAYIQENTSIPVLGHTEGVCHVVVDASADVEEAVDVVVDAKTDYPAACNAVEGVLVHADAAEVAVPALVEALVEAGVEVRADEGVRELAPEAGAAGEDDWGREFGDLVLAMRVVDDFDEACGLVNEVGSSHTDAILTGDEARGRAFARRVDSASVMVNASTRFADGYRYGLGAEVGISTGKTHARGPVGPEGLTTTRWILEGQGHRAGDYRGEDARPFQHVDLGEDWDGA
jgi:glutamate-5-semialdehyde dehydrogenase